MDIKKPKNTEKIFLQIDTDEDGQDILIRYEETRYNLWLKKT